MTDLLGWCGCIAAMSIPIPQLLRPARVSRLTYVLAAITHCLYLGAGIGSGKWWLVTSAAFGLVVSTMVIWRCRK